MWLSLIVRFVPFSELIQWTDNLSPEVMAPQSFDEELTSLEQAAKIVWQPTTITSYVEWDNLPSCER